jgi:hypothetical protein
VRKQPSFTNVFLVIVSCVAVLASIGYFSQVTKPAAIVPTQTAVATATATQIPTQTPTVAVTPTITQTPVPTWTPAPTETPVSGPVGSGWQSWYEFGGGPSVLVKAECFNEGLNKCQGKEVQIYLSGYQSEDVYLNGTNESEHLWTIRLVPGNNTLVVPSIPGSTVALANTPLIEVSDTRMTGYYRQCDENELKQCICTDYHDNTIIYQSPYGESYLTTVWFVSEYSEVWYFNDLVAEKSIPITSGTILVLPRFSLDSRTWDIAVLPDFGPMPTRIPTVSK